MLESERKLVDTLVNVVKEQKNLQYQKETNKVAPINYHALGTLAHILVLRVLEEREANGIG